MRGFSYYNSGLLNIRFKLVFTVKQIISLPEEQELIRSAYLINRAHLAYPIPKK